MKRYTYFDFSGPFLKHYDHFNHMASAGFDYYWRHSTAAKAADLYHQHRWSLPVLDLACGTGDMAAAIHRQIDSIVVIGSDPSADMLALAKEKKHRLDWRRFLPMRAVNQLPFRDASVGAITCAFGVRNFVHLAEDIQECRRVLRSGGRIYLLDFYKPQNRFSHSLLYIYKKFAAPLIGVALTGHAQPYRYLIASMYAFRTPEEMMTLLIKTGLRAVEIHAFFFGLVHLVIAEKI